MLNEVKKLSKRKYSYPEANTNALVLEKVSKPSVVKWCNEIEEKLYRVKMVSMILIHELCR